MTYCDISTPDLCDLLAVKLEEAAKIAEIVRDRGGRLEVDHNQLSFYFKEIHD